MPLPQADIEYLSSIGLNPDEYDLDASGDNYVKRNAIATQPATSNTDFPQPKLTPQTFSPVGTAAGTFVHEAPSAVAGGFGFGQGLKLGSKVPGPPWAKVAGGLAGGIAAGLGAGGAARYLQGLAEQPFIQAANEYTDPFNPRFSLIGQWLQKLQASQAANPKSALAGSIATMPLAGMNPSPVNTTKALQHGLPWLIGRRPPPEQLANIANVGIGAALQPAIGVGQRLMAGEPIEGKDVLLETLLGALFNKPNALGKAYGFSPTPFNTPHPTPEVVGPAPVETMPPSAPLTPTEIVSTGGAPYSHGLRQVRVEEKGKTAGYRQHDLTKRWKESPFPTEDELARMEAEGRPAPQPTKQAPLPEIEGVIYRDPSEPPEPLSVIPLPDKPVEGVPRERALVRTQPEQQPPVTKARYDAEGNLISGRFLSEQSSAPAQQNRPFTEFEKEVSTKVEKLPPLNLQRWNQMLANWLQTERGATSVAEDVKLPIAGDTVMSWIGDKLRKMAIRLGPKAGFDTLPHEGLHGFFGILRTSPKAFDKMIVSKGERIVSNSPEFKAVNAERTAQGRRPWTPEEFLVSEAASEYVARQMKIQGETEFKQWWNDLKNHVKVRFSGKELTPADLRRYFNYRYQTDAAFKRFANGGPAPTAGAAATVQQSEESSVPALRSGWMDAEGKFTGLDYGDSHYAKAAQIANRFAQRLDEDNNINELRKRNYLRLRKDFDGKLYVEGDPTPKQLSVLRNYAIENSETIYNEFGGKLIAPEQGGLGGREGINLRSDQASVPISSPDVINLVLNAETGAKDGTMTTDALREAKTTLLAQVDFPEKLRTQLDELNTGSGTDWLRFRIALQKATKEAPDVSGKNVGVEIEKAMGKASVSTGQYGEGPTRNLLDLTDAIKRRNVEPDGDVYEGGQKIPPTDEYMTRFLPRIENEIKADQDKIAELKAARLANPKADVTEIRKHLLADARETTWGEAIRTYQDTLQDSMQYRDDHILANKVYNQKTSKAPTPDLLALAKTATPQPEETGLAPGATGGMSMGTAAMESAPKAPRVATPKSTIKEAPKYSTRGLESVSAPKPTSTSADSRIEADRKRVAALLNEPIKPGLRKLVQYNNLMDEADNWPYTSERARALRAKATEIANYFREYEQKHGLPQQELRIKGIDFLASEESSIKLRSGWMDATGKFTGLDYGDSHHAKAAQIANRFTTRLDEDNNINELRKRNYLRLRLDPGNGRLYVEGDPTPKQLSVLRNYAIENNERIYNEFGSVLIAPEQGGLGGREGINLRSEESSVKKFSSDEIKAELEVADVYKSMGLFNRLWEIGKEPLKDSNGKTIMPMRAPNSSVAAHLYDPVIKNYVSLDDRFAVVQYLLNGGKEKIYWMALDKNNNVIVANARTTGVTGTRDVELFKNAIRDGSVFNVASHRGVSKVIPVLLTPKHGIYEDTGTYGYFGGQKVLKKGPFDVRIQKPDIQKLEKMFPDAEEPGGPPITFAESDAITLLRNHPLAQETKLQSEESSIQLRSPFYATRFGKVFSPLAPEIERVRNHSPEGKVAAEGLDEFYRSQSRLRGELEQRLIRNLLQTRRPQNFKEFWTQDNPDYQAVVKWLDIKSDGETPSFELTPKQKEIEQTVRENLLASHAMREARPGLKHFTSADPYYLPHVLSREAATELANNPTSEKSVKYFEDFMQYQMKRNNLSREAALKAWKIVRGAFTKESHNLAQKFGPIDESSGIGLPRSMREQNLMDRMARFNRRYARRIAYHDSIEKNEKVSDALFNKEHGMESNENAKNVLEDIYGVREHQEAKRNAALGIVRAGMLGPLTGAKDFVSNIFLGMQHQDASQILPSLKYALENFKENYERAINKGSVRYNISGLELGDGGIDNAVNILQRARDVINTAQGRQLLETATRIVAFGQGRYLAVDALAALRNKNLSFQKGKFLKDFVKNWEKYKTEVADENVINEAAANYVDSVQGMYDYRGQPNITMKGTFAPILSLARWNVEKFNNFVKHNVEPARQGNFKPLLMSTIGMLIGGTAVNALVEAATGRKERTPKWKEIAASDEQAMLTAYKLAGLSSMAGYAGIMGDLIRSALDVQFKNRPQIYNNPLIDGLASAGDNAQFLIDAMREGDLPGFTDVLNQVLLDYFQVYRLAAAHLSPEQQADLEKRAKLRDVKIFKAGAGLPLSPYSSERPNPYIDKSMREFKRTGSMEEAVTLLPELIQKAVEDANGDPEKLKAEFLRLKLNNYQTMPSPETMPKRFWDYYMWLSETQGPEEAAKRLEDYIVQNAVNKAKASMIP